MLTIQHSGPDGEITTTFEYDGIQRLVRVTDTESNVTTTLNLYVHPNMEQKKKCIIKMFKSLGK